MADSSSISLSLPNAGGSFGTDSIRAGNLDCQHAIGSSTNVEFGITGVVANAIAPIIGKTDPLNSPPVKDFGFYARLTIPLDAPERINCNTLYQMELQVRSMEIEKLSLELEKLKQLQQTTFDN